MQKVTISHLLCTKCPGTTASLGENMYIKVYISITHNARPKPNNFKIDTKKFIYHTKSKISLLR